MADEYVPTVSGADFGGPVEMQKSWLQPTMHSLQQLAISTSASLRAACTCKALKQSSTTGDWPATEPAYLQMVHGWAKYANMYETTRPRRYVALLPQSTENCPRNTSYFYEYGLACCKCRQQLGSFKWLIRSCMEVVRLSPPCVPCGDRCPKGSTRGVLKQRQVLLVSPGCRLHTISLPYPLLLRNPLQA